MVTTRGEAPLLATKLHAPRRRNGVVRRARLLNRAVGRDQPAVTLVLAPAGFGKTTLLTELFARDDTGTPALAWVSLDARDNDPRLFWSYVIAALQTVAPELGETAPALVDSDPSELEAVVATVVNDLDLLPMDVVIVLDDYHVIESSEIHESVAFLLDHLPPQIRLAIASRSDPPLPLARLRVRGELLEIRAADLRFTVEEASSYFRESMNLDISEDDVAVLERRTEGWIAALQLAALSLQGRDDVDRFISNFTGDERFVVDYLAEEVLERQPQDVGDFLLRTSILGGLTGPLCDAVINGAGSKAMLETLERANLFVVPLDDHRVWYRYHHLFRSVLRARLVEERSDEIDELHRRASAWYEANGEPAEAIGHALAGNDFERSARLIELATPAMRRTRQEPTLREWLETIPDSLFEDRPVLSATLAGSRMATGDATDIEPLLQIADRWLDTTGEGAARPVVYDDDQLVSLPAEVAMYRAALALLTGDRSGAIHHAKRVFEVAPSSDHYRRGAAAALIGLAHWAGGELEPARASYADAVRSFVAADFIPDLLGVSLGLADIQIAQGRLQDARQTFEAALEHARDQPGLRGTADMYVGLSDVCFELNDLNEAARHLHAGREHGDSAGLPQNPYRWRAAQARLLDAQGDVEGALELLDEAERVYNTDFSPPIRPIPALKARIALHRGDVDAARRWVSAVGITIEDELTYIREFEHITLARTLLAQGTAANDPSIRDAIALLERLLGAAEGRGSGSTIEILVLLAGAHHTRGDTALATATLDRAVALADEHGYVRVFVEEGPTVAALLQNTSLHGGAAGHAQRVLAACQTAPETPRHSGMIDELSSRELDVLRLLRTELSGPDIARELFVSLNTLRTHTKSIYAKLGVNTRREAVRRAEELGL